VQGQIDGLIGDELFALGESGTGKICLEGRCNRLLILDRGCELWSLASHIPL
jgi:hypothetical protein